jgi:hypothetical protein
VFITVQNSLVGAHHEHAVTEPHGSCEGVLLGLVMVVMVVVMVQQIGGPAVTVRQDG